MRTPPFVACATLLLALLPPAAAEEPHPLFDVTVDHGNVGFNCDHVLARGTVRSNTTQEPSVGVAVRLYLTRNMGTVLAMGLTNETGRFDFMTAGPHSGQEAYTLTFARPDAAGAEQTLDLPTSNSIGECGGPGPSAEMAAAALFVAAAIAGTRWRRKDS